MLSPRKHTVDGCEIRVAHFATMVETRTLVGIYGGIISFQGVSRGTRLVSLRASGGQPWTFRRAGEPSGGKYHPGELPGVSFDPNEK